MKMKKSAAYRVLVWGLLLSFLMVSFSFVGFAKDASFANMTSVEVYQSNIQIYFDKDIASAYEYIDGNNGIVLSVNGITAPLVTGVQWAPDGVKNKIVLFTNGDFSIHPYERIILPPNLGHVSGAKISDEKGLTYVGQVGVWTEKQTPKMTSVEVYSSNVQIYFDSDVSSVYDYIVGDNGITFTAQAGTAPTVIGVQWAPGGVNNKIVLFTSGDFTSCSGRNIVFPSYFGYYNGANIAGANGLLYIGYGDLWQQKSAVETTNVTFLGEHGISNSTNGLVLIAFFGTDVGPAVNTADPIYLNSITATLDGETQSPTFIQWNPGTGTNSAILFFPNSIFSDTQNMIITFKPNFSLPNGIKLATVNRAIDLQYEGMDSSWQIKANIGSNKITGISKVISGNNANYLYVAWFENPLFPEGSKLIGSNYIGNDKITIDGKTFTMQWGEIWSNSVFLFLDHIQIPGGSETKLEIADQGRLKVLAGAKTPTGQTIEENSFIKFANLETWSAGVQFGSLRITDNAITNLYQNINIGDILGNISNYDSIQFKDKLGANVSDNNVKMGTASSVVINANGSNSTYTFILKGDVDGDSQITVSDLAKVKLHLLKSAELTGAYKTAGELGQGRITISSLIAIKKQILEIATIAQ